VDVAATKTAQAVAMQATVAATLTALPTVTFTPSATPTPTPTSSPTPTSTPSPTPAPIETPVPTAVVFPAGEFRITTAPADQTVPDIWGDVVVWADERHGRYDLYGYNLSQKREFAVTDDQSLGGFVGGPPYIKLPLTVRPRVQGGLIVWVADPEKVDEPSRLMSYNLSTNERFVFARMHTWIMSWSGEGVFVYSSISLSDGFVVWQDKVEEDFDIYGYDLSEEKQFTIVAGLASQITPGVSGNIVVWTDGRNGQWDVYGYDLSSRTEFPIVTVPSYQFAPATSSDYVVWVDERNGNPDIYGYNLRTKQEFPIVTDPFTQTQPAISGNIVVWTDERNGNKDIYGYNLSTGKELQVTTDPADQESPAIFGGTVVWADKRNGNWDIYGAIAPTDFIVAETGRDFEAELVTVSKKDSVSACRFLGGSDKQTPEAGSVFLVVELRWRDLGRYPEDAVSSLNVVLTDHAGRKFYPDGSKDPRGCFFFAGVTSSKVFGVLDMSYLFSVPADARDFQLRIFDLPSIELDL
jgi:beta propeller repeat protein